MPQHPQWQRLILSDSSQQILYRYFLYHCEYSRAEQHDDQTRTNNLTDGRIVAWFLDDDHALDRWLHGDYDDHALDGRLNINRALAGILDDNHVLTGHLHIHALVGLSDEDHAFAGRLHYDHVLSESLSDDQALVGRLEDN